MLPRVKEKMRNANAAQLMEKSLVDTDQEVAQIMV